MHDARRVVRVLSDFLRSFGVPTCYFRVRSLGSRLPEPGIA